MNIPKKFETTPEILGFIHNIHLQNQANGEAFVNWECVDVTGSYLPERDEVLNE
jgi:hypothetical protein